MTLSQSQNTSVDGSTPSRSTPDRIAAYSQRPTPHRHFEVSWIVEVPEPHHPPVLDGEHHHPVVVVAFPGRHHSPGVAALDNDPVTRSSEYDIPGCFGTYVRRHGLEVLDEFPATRPRPGPPQRRRANRYLTNSMLDSGDMRTSSS